MYIYISLHICTWELGPGKLRTWYMYISITIYKYIYIYISTCVQFLIYNCVLQEQHLFLLRTDMCNWPQIGNPIHLSSAPELINDLLPLHSLLIFGSGLILVHSRSILVAHGVHFCTSSIHLGAHEPILGCHGVIYRVGGVLGASSGALGGKGGAHFTAGPQACWAAHSNILASSPNAGETFTTNHARSTIYL